MRLFGRSGRTVMLHTNAPPYWPETHVERPKLRESETTQLMKFLRRLAETMKKRGDVQLKVMVEIMSEEGILGVPAMVEERGNKIRCLLLPRGY